MSLLLDTMANTLDEGYAARAAQARTSPGARLRRVGPSGVLVLVALGLVTGTAVAQVRGSEQSARGLRAELAEQARARSTQGDALAEQARRLSAAVERSRARALGGGRAADQATDRLAVLGLASATVPVRGPGVVITLDDAPAPGGAESLEPAGGGVLGRQRVQDRDLQDVVNGLWAAGAEAVAVNDQRLTAVTAIRSAGETILADFTVLTAPYVVSAIGDAAALQVRFVDGPVGRRLAGYPQLYGIAVDVRRADELRLPGATTRGLAVASPVPGAR